VTHAWVAYGTVTARWFASSGSVAINARTCASTFSRTGAGSPAMKLVERTRFTITSSAGVIASPRCQNCHPVGERPTQGDDMHPHLPLVVRGKDDMGAIAMRCATCHQAANFEPAGVPGHPQWHMAPVEMAWQTKSLGQICEQIKDPDRNGKRSLAQLLDHMAHDDLVGWAWRPGGTRTPAPGTQQQFGALIAAWIQTGAQCPAA
jgi:hypothetical protein